MRGTKKQNSNENANDKSKQKNQRNNGGEKQDEVFFIILLTVSLFRLFSILSKLGDKVPHCAFLITFPRCIHLNYIKFNLGQGTVVPERIQQKECNCV